MCLAPYWLSYRLPSVLVVNAYICGESASSDSNLMGEEWRLELYYTTLRQHLNPDLRLYRKSSRSKKMLERYLSHLDWQLCSRVLKKAARQCTKKLRDIHQDQRQRENLRYGDRLEHTPQILSESARGSASSFNVPSSVGTVMQIVWSELKFHKDCKVQHKAV